jgi:S1-C subfamily serine protease
MTAMPLVLLLMVTGQSDGTPLTKSKSFSDAMQWKSAESCVRIGNRFRTGSGMIVAIRDKSAIILTAQHAVDAGGLYDIDFFAKASYPGKHRTVKGISVAARNATIDVAILTVSLSENDPEPPVVPLIALKQRPSRFPITGVPSLAVGCEDGFSPKCFDDRILKKKAISRPEGKLAFFWETSIPPREGRSGGGLIDAEGRLLGICSANMSSLGYFTHIDEIHAWLKQLPDYQWLVEPGQK